MLCAHQITTHSARRCRSRRRRLSFRKPRRKKASLRRKHFPRKIRKPAGSILVFPPPPDPLTRWAHPSTGRQDERTKKCQPSCHYREEDLNISTVSEGGGTTTINVWRSGGLTRYHILVRWAFPRFWGNNLGRFRKWLSSHFKFSRRSWQINEAYKSEARIIAGDLLYLSLQYWLLIDIRKLNQFCKQNQTILTNFKHCKRILNNFKQF